MSLGNNSVNPPAAVPGELFAVKGAHSADPLAFIKGNLREPTPQVAPSQEIKPEPVAIPIPKVEVAPAPEVVVEGVEDFSPVEPEAKQEPLTPEEEFPELAADTMPDADRNWGILKSALKEKKAALKEVSEQKAQLEAELQDYKVGKKMPDHLQAKEEEISQLRRYQKIVDLKASPEYQEAHVKPLKEVRSKVDHLLTTEYGFPKEELAELRSMDFKSQNAWLERELDAVGALQIRDLLDKEKQIVGGMQQAEKEPEQEFERLMQEGARAREVRQAQQKSAIKETFRDGWARSLLKIRQEGKFPELTPKESDSQYNKNIVDPIVRNAATEGGKFVAMLVEDGLTKLRPEVAEFISNMCLHAHSSILNATTRERAMAYADELKKNTTRINNVIRPPIGGSTGASVGEPQAREAMTADKLGGAILDKIGVRR